MEEYSFEQENGNGTYQLVKTRHYRKYWILKKEEKVKLPVHLNYNPWKRLIITAEDDKGSASNEFQCSVERDSIETSQLFSILKNLNITEKDLLEARLPIDSNPRLVDDLPIVINRIFAGRKYKKRQKV